MKTYKKASLNKRIIAFVMDFAVAAVILVVGFFLADIPVIGPFIYGLLLLGGWGYLVVKDGENEPNENHREVLEKWQEKKEEKGEEIDSDMVQSIIEVDEEEEKKPFGIGKNNQKLMVVDLKTNALVLSKKVWVREFVFAVCFAAHALIAFVLAGSDDDGTIIGLVLFLALGIFSVRVVVDLLMVMGREDGRTIGDLFAGTQVVEIEEFEKQNKTV